MDKEKRPAGGADLTGAMVETFAESLIIPAGAQAKIRCIVSRNRVQIEGVVVAVDVTPSPGEISVDDFTAVFTPTVVGTYTVKCRVPGENIRDETGLTLTVVPALPGRVDTRLDQESAVAGASVSGECLVFDGFDNLVLFTDVPVGAASPVLDASESLTVVSQQDLTFVIRGSTAGLQEVACSYYGVVDDTPATLEILPGDPAKTNTSITPESAVATEKVLVSCEVFDAWDNLLTGYDTTFSVVAEDGSDPIENGLIVDGGGFTVAEAGEYYVFCQVVGHSAGDESPAVAVISAGLPFRWEVQVLEQECYWQDLNFPITYEVYDRWGNLMESPGVSVTVVPDSGVVTDAQGRFHFTAEGDYDITVKLSGALDPFAEVAPVVLSVRVDSTPPDFTFDTVSRGAMLQSGTASDLLVKVQGSVRDLLSPITMATVAGQPLTITPDSLEETFSVDANSRWGVSIVSGMAEDECGNRGNIAHSFLRSPAYKTPTLGADVNARVSTGLLAHVNQMALDDQYRGDTDDLATLAEGLLADVDLSGVLPTKLVFSPENGDDGSGNLKKTTYTCDGQSVENEVTGYWVRLNGALQFGDPAVEYLTAISDGVKFKAGLEDIVIPLKIHASLDLECNGVIAETLTGEVRIGALSLAGEAATSFVNRVPKVTFEPGSVGVDFSDVTLDFDWGSLSFMNDDLNEMTTEIIATLEEPLEGVLGEVLRGQVGGLISDFLNDVQVSESFDVPEPISMTLNLITGLDYFNFDGPEGAGFAELGLYTQIYPTSRGDTVPADSKGAIYRSAELPIFSPAYAFGVGLSDNTLNQVLWSLWYGGALALDDLTTLGVDLGFDGIDFSLDATMPPVLMPGRNGNQVELGLGDAFIRADVNLSEALGLGAGGDQNLVSVEMYLSMIMGAELTTLPDTNSIRMTFDRYPEVWIEITDINYSGYEAEMTDLFTSLMKLVIPRLLEDAFKSIPLPEFDVSDLAGLGDDVVWRLQSDSISRNKDYYRLTGSME